MNAEDRDLVRGSYIFWDFREALGILVQTHLAAAVDVV